MSAYEELVDECAKAARKGAYDDGQYWERVNTADQEFWRGVARGVLAEALRALKIVTPEMEAASDDVEEPGEELWLAMLSASPITPP